MKPTTFRLPFPRQQVQPLADAYSYAQCGEVDVEGSLAAEVRKQQFYNKSQFLQVCLLEVASDTVALCIQRFSARRDSYPSRADESR